MARLAMALNFILDPDHPSTVPLPIASDGDVKAARALFLKLEPSDRRAALAMLGD